MANVAPPTPQKSPKRLRHTQESGLTEYVQQTRRSTRLGAAQHPIADEVPRTIPSSSTAPIAFTPECLGALRHSNPLEQPRRCPKVTAAVRVASMAATFVDEAEEDGPAISLSTANPVVEEWADIAAMYRDIDEIYKLCPGSNYSQSVDDRRSRPSGSNVEIEASRGLWRDYDVMARHNATIDDDIASQRAGTFRGVAASSLILSSEDGLSTPHSSSYEDRRAILRAVASGEVEQLADMWQAEPTDTIGPTDHVEYAVPEQDDNAQQPAKQKWSRRLTGIFGIANWGKNINKIAAHSTEQLEHPHLVRLFRRRTMTDHNTQSARYTAVSSRSRSVDDQTTRPAQNPSRKLGRRSSWNTLGKWHFGRKDSVVVDDIASSAGNRHSMSSVLDDPVMERRASRLRKAISLDILRAGATTKVSPDASDSEPMSPGTSVCPRLKTLTRDSFGNDLEGWISSNWRAEMPKQDQDGVPSVKDWAAFRGRTPTTSSSKKASLSSRASQETVIWAQAQHIRAASSRRSYSSRSYSTASTNTRSVASDDWLPDWIVARRARGRPLER